MEGLGLPELLRKNCSGLTCILRWARGTFRFMQTPQLGMLSLGSRSIVFYALLV